MATNSLSSRLGELRHPQSPPNERAYSGYSTPTRYSANFSNMHAPSQSVSTSNDIRSSSMQRRFTADSNTYPSPLSPINYQSMDATGSLNTYHKAQALDKKERELEKIREQRKRLQEDFDRISAIQHEQESEVARLSQDLRTMNLAPGYQSEPTTPPEYRDSSLYSSAFNSRNRYSSASLTSPPGLNRMSRSGSQVTSPPNEAAHGGHESEKFASSNRYSMPASLSARQKRESIADFPAVGLAPIDTTSNLFEDDDENEIVASPAMKNYLQNHNTDDKFPVLLTNKHKPGTLSASSAALDLASLGVPSTDAKVEARTNGWPTFNRQHQAQQSLPHNNLNGRSNLHTPSSSQHSVETVVESPNVMRNVNRLSLQATLAALSNQADTNGGNNITNSRPSLGGYGNSVSMSAIPTVKGVGAAAPSNTVIGEKGFHKHTTSITRGAGAVPGPIMTNRLSRDLTTGETLADEPPATAKLPTTSSELQANAAPFGPSLSAVNGNDNALMNSTAMGQFDGSTYFPYGMSALNMGANQMQVNPMNGTGYANGMQYFPQQNQQHSTQFFNGNQYNPGGRFNDSQQKVIQQRRAQNAEGNRRRSRRSSGAHSDPDTAKFANTKIENYAGEIYSLCKDQHGCRYLQKQLENRQPEIVQLIFSETAPHVIELMTDPFGNYLCQKLLEHTNDAQRTTLVENAAPHMVEIALNQHGTRALQKMIEYLSTDEQIKVVRNALEDKVVELIQDLNGNHVIQKCLNRLTAEESQFIFNAVGKNCVIVGTHRHGCCVLQRCIDHASGQQKADLIAQITGNAFKLVQDPYGNYVLQYIVDLNEKAFTNPLCYTLQTRVVELSKHKFSSNVIEKCIRHAEPSVASLMIEEMLGAAEIERMLRDSFANYVIQTALDAAEPETRARLVEAIRPFLPSIKATPHGRRIQSKVLQSENSSQGPSPTMTPMPGSGPPIRGPGPMNRNGSGSFQNYYGQQPQGVFGMNGFTGQGGFNQMGGPVGAQRINGNGGFGFNPMNQQNSIHQAMPQGYGRAPQPNGYNYF